METNDEIEMLLWEYMDGTCSEGDMHRVSVLIARDELWRQKYEELQTLQADITSNMHIEEPSMRFTKNVMEAIATAHVAPATRKYINKYIIGGIAVFFALLICGLFVYAFAHVNSNTTSSLPGPGIRNFDYGQLFNSSTFMAFMAVNVALGLLLLDTLLRRRHRHAG